MADDISEKQNEATAILDAPMESTEASGYNPPVDMMKILTEDEGDAGIPAQLPRKARIETQSNPANYGAAWEAPRATGAKVVEDAPTTSESPVPKGGKIAEILQRKINRTDNMINRVTAADPRRQNS